MQTGDGRMDQETSGVMFEGGAGSVGVMDRSPEAVSLTVDSDGVEGGEIARSCMEGRVSARVEEVRSRWIDCVCNMEENMTSSTRFVLGKG